MQSPLARLAFVGGYVPRRCGIATFTHDLFQSIAAASPGTDCFVGAVTDRPEGYDYPRCVRFQIAVDDPDSYRRAAEFLHFNKAGILCLQHEFGIYGGPAGSHVLTLLREARMPVVTTLHTVLSNPDIAQRKVMDEVIRRSDRLVVMARRGEEILRETYGVDPGRIDIIPHGIPDIAFADSAPFKESIGLGGRTVLLTFGLLGPGKGIEYAIQALPRIVEKHPEVTYLILGATHPHLVAREGEKYRRSLEALAEECGVSNHLVFEDRFVSLDDLKCYISAADIYLTPYPNEAQITSGTLAQAYGAGKAIVSTPFWHAQELLGDGSGVLVASRDAQAIAEGVCGLLDDPARMQLIRRKAYEAGRAMIWPAVAERYLDSFRKAKETAETMSNTNTPILAKLPPRRLDHIIGMTDSTGIFQHASYNVPNYDEGYCVDDNARAFLLCSLLDDGSNEFPAETLRRLSSTYLAFLSAALNRGNGRFRNFMSHGRIWLEESGSEDSHGRTLWATGTGAAHSRNDGHRLLCRNLFNAALPAVKEFPSPRAWVFTLLGLHEYLKIFPNDGPALEMQRELIHRLLALWKRNASAAWPWFESSLSYDNARISQALIANGNQMGDREALETGLASLKWLAEVQTTRAGHFRPIGSNGFFEKDGVRADFDQQPVEAQAMVSACLEAWRVTSRQSWKREAQRAFNWFLGHNDLGLPLHDSRTGGCCDGLHPDRVNANQGAESSLAFSLSLAEMHLAENVLSRNLKCTA
jgi:glycosyltransferase involved in cell wall biosynthesis